MESADNKPTHHGSTARSRPSDEPTIATTPPANKRNSIKCRCDQEQSHGQPISECYFCSGAHVRHSDQLSKIDILFGIDSNSCSNSMGDGHSSIAGLSGSHILFDSNSNSNSMGDDHSSIAESSGYPILLNLSSNSNSNSIGDDHSSITELSRSHILFGSNSHSMGNEHSSTSKPSGPHIDAEDSEWLIVDAYRAGFESISAQTGQMQKMDRFRDEPLKDGPWFPQL